MEYETFIECTPVPKGRPRATKSGRIYTPAKTRAYEDMLRVATKDSPMFTGKVTVNLIFHFLIPKSRRTGKKKVEHMEPHLQRPDLDNLIKCIDAFNGSIWLDDTQIYAITASKFWNEGEQGVYLNVTDS